jgi:hypothetical protein
VDSDERKEKEWGRAQEREENRKSRRISVLIAGIALIGAIAGTVGATLGAKWGANTTLEVQDREFKAERQKQTRELCLQLNTELDNATKAVFPLTPKDAKKVNPDRVYEQAARWDALSHRAAVVAPLAIYDTAQNVSSVLRDKSSSVASSSDARERLLRALIAYQREVKKLQQSRQIRQALELDKEVDARLRELSAQQREVEKIKSPSPERFEAAAHQLRNACRTELGEQPLPTPTQTR